MNKYNRKDQECGTAGKRDFNFSLNMPLCKQAEHGHYNVNYNFIQSVYKNDIQVYKDLETSITQAPEQSISDCLLPVICTFENLIRRPCNKTAEKLAVGTNISPGKFIVTGRHTESSLLKININHICQGG
jgi:hypothetical protein